MNLLRHGMTPKMKPLPLKRAMTVSVIDIGTSKIACLIARLRPSPAQDVLPRRTHAIEVIGVGHTRSAGIKGGIVVNLAEAEEAIRNAVAAAERMASVHLESVIVSVSGGRPSSELYAASVNASGPSITDLDIERVLGVGSQHSVREGRAVLHSLPTGYSLDEAKHIRDPRGMLGRNLGVDMHVVTLEAAAARNLMLCVERCHLAVEAMVAAPYVAGLAALSDDEADLGAAVVDIGAGTTTISVFSGGHFVHCDGFALGGRHVTMDVARGLNARIADAERAKALYGSVLTGAADDRETITIAPAGDGGEPPQVVTRANLVSIIKPRAEEILEMVRDRLAVSPFATEPRGRVVFTGGGSLLNGLPELAARVLGRNVRIGRPLGFAGLPEAAKGPAFTAAAGLLVYPQFAYLEHFEPRRARQLMTGTDSYFGRVGRWLKESF